MAPAAGGCDKTANVPSVHNPTSWKQPGLVALCSSHPPNTVMTSNCSTSGLKQSPRSDPSLLSHRLFIRDFITLSSTSQSSPAPALAHPPTKFPPGASLGTTTGVSVGREPKPAPLPQARPGHSLSESASAPSVREGGGDTGQQEAAAGLGGVGQCGLGSPAAWLAQPSGSPARCCLARSGRGCLLRVRPGASGASVRAGTPARLFCFRFCFWEGTCGRPAPPPPAEHTGKCSSCILLGGCPGRRSSPTVWAQRCQVWVSLCKWILIK